MNRSSDKRRRFKFPFADISHTVKNAVTIVVNQCFEDPDELFPSAHSLSEEVLQGIQQGGLMSLILVEKADDVAFVSMSNG